MLSSTSLPCSSSSSSARRVAYLWYMSRIPPRWLYVVAGSTSSCADVHWQLCRSGSAGRGSHCWAAQSGHMPSRTSCLAAVCTVQCRQQEVGWWSWTGHRLEIG
jgi:hypothetical protein